MAMMTGELNYSDAFERLESTGRLTGLKYELLLFVVFIIIINISFANLLVRPKYMMHQIALILSFN